jgi:hypothetical protein
VRPFSSFCPRRFELRPALRTLSRLHNLRVTKKPSTEGFFCAGDGLFTSKSQKQGTGTVNRSTQVNAFSHNAEFRFKPSVGCTHRSGMIGWRSCPEIQNLHTYVGQRTLCNTGSGLRSSSTVRLISPEISNKSSEAFVLRKPLRRMLSHIPASATW